MNEFTDLPSSPLFNEQTLVGLAYPFLVETDLESLTMTRLEMVNALLDQTFAFLRIILPPQTRLKQPDEESSSTPETNVLPSDSNQSTLPSLWQPVLPSSPSFPEPALPSSSTSSPIQPASSLFLAPWALSLPTWGTLATAWVETKTESYFNDSEPASYHRLVVTSSVGPLSSRSGYPRSREPLIYVRVVFV